MSHVEIRHLRYFVAVAEELSFARAAERLHISQPPLTRQIQRLEDELGVQLFDRTTRRVQLTEAGRVFLDEARAALAQVERGVNIAQRVDRGEVGQLVVGFEASSAHDLVAKSLRVFRERHPEVGVVLLQMHSDEQARALRESRIIVGFVLPPLHDNTLVVETVLREPLVAAIPNNHPLGCRAKVALKELASEGFVMSSPSNRCGLYDQVISVCAKAGFRPKVVQEANEMQVMLGFIAAGTGLSLLPEHVQQFQKPGVLYRPLTPAWANVELAVAWRRRDNSPILGAFLEVVRECARAEIKVAAAPPKAGTARRSEVGEKYGLAACARRDPV